MGGELGKRREESKPFSPTADRRGEDGDEAPKCCAGPLQLCKSRALVPQQRSAEADQKGPTAKETASVGCGLWRDGVKEGAEEKREANGESCMVNGKSSGHLKREFPESGSKKLRLTLQKDNVSLPLFLADKAKPCLIDLEDDSAGSDSSSERKREYILPSTSCSNIKQDLGSAEDPMNQKESPSLALQSARNVENGSKPPPHHFIDDISKGMEKVKISLLDESGKGDIPRFFYIPQNIVYQNAHVSISLARISDDDSCPACSGDCLSSPVPCACARETSGEFAYNTSNGLLKEDFLNSCISLKRDPQKHHYVYCQECPLERVKNDTMPDPCKGHLLRRFVKECWSKCGCDMRCGNRVVQRGIAHSLQVFWTPEGKGWGLRSTEDLPKGAFVCEYVGEIMTNTELYERNLHNSSKRHTYPVNLDADWGSESILKDEEALCLDATVHGNVARFINHRCYDSNLLDIPVEVETLDRHYYHLAFFTTKEVQAYEELSWDYEIDFNDQNHPIEAFQCRCGSDLCRGRSSKSKGKRKVTS